MWPVGWCYIKWWILLSTSKGTECTTPHHPITNLEYRLKPHHKSQLLRARLDTCADVNIMPMSIYKLVFQDTDCKKLTPSSKLEIGTYTTDKMKVVGSCILYTVHPDNQCLQEVTFHVTSHEGSVVLSCVTTLALSLIQPCTSLDCLPPLASLITSSADHPMMIYWEIKTYPQQTDPPLIKPRSTEPDDTI